MKLIILAVVLTLTSLVVSCGPNADNSSTDPQNKTSCKGINTEGTATFSKFSKDSNSYGKTNVTMSWIASDGTVYDTTKYILQTSDQCISDEALAVGSTTLVQVWVQCPVAPKVTSIQPFAIAPFGFNFPNLTSPQCEWTYESTSP
jgi:hypothetical protein